MATLSAEHGAALHRYLADGEHCEFRRVGGQYQASSPRVGMIAGTKAPLVILQAWAGAPQIFLDTFTAWIRDELRMGERLRVKRKAEGFHVVAYNLDMTVARVAEVDSSAQLQGAVALALAALRGAVS